MHSKQIVITVALPIANVCEFNYTHSNYNNIHYWTNPKISLIRTGAGPKLFGLVRFHCSCIFMVKLRNYFFRSKIQHKHQHEILSTFMKITTINKFKNKQNSTKFNTNIINVMLSTFMKIENHKSKQWSCRHSLLSSSAFY